MTSSQFLAAKLKVLSSLPHAAGGFLGVAQSLNLRSRRRPNGFWEDMKNLDAETEWFVSSSWTKVKDPETDIGTRRKLVAQQLGRQPVSKDTKFTVKIKSFMEEHSMSHFPAMKELRACGRHDFAYLLRRQGGMNVVCEIMDIRPRIYGRGQWSDMEVAAAAIRAYICNKLILERGLNESTMDRSGLEDMVWKDALRAGTLVIPSQTHFLRNNRSDLRYLLQKFGREELSHYMGVKFVPWGKKETHLKWRIKVSRGIGHFCTGFQCQVEQVVIIARQHFLRGKHGSGHVYLENTNAHVGCTSGVSWEITLLEIGLAMENVEALN
ncbi:unnamed protein product [Calypogeia fissa]